MGSTPFVFYASPPPQHAERFAVVSVGHFRFEGSQRGHRPHGWHVEHLIYTMGGAAIGTIAGQRSRATAGSIWITPKDRPYTYWTDPAVGAWEGRWVEFDGAWVRPLWSMMGLSGVVHVPQCLEAGPVIEKLHACLEARGDAGAVEASAWLWHLFATVHDHLAGETGAARPSDRAVAQAQAYVRAHLAEPIGLADMAREARMSPHHFARVFRTKSGFTPVAFLRALRVSRAQELLRRGDFNITEVGQAVGYATVQNFSRVFRRLTGRSPRQFVRAHRDSLAAKT